jgi:hypothetical protein
MPKYKLFPSFVIIFLIAVASILSYHLGASQSSQKVVSYNVKYRTESQTSAQENSLASVLGDDDDDDSDDDDSDDDDGDDDDGDDDDSDDDDGDDDDSDDDDDETPPSFPGGRELSCEFTVESGGISYYEVTYSWDTVVDVGGAGMHDYPYWSQISKDDDYDEIADWYNSWDDVISRTSSISFQEGSILYAHVRARDVNNNQSPWSPDSGLILNSSNCTGISPTQTPTVAPTATITNTPTPTNTPRATRTPTPTLSVSPTPLNSPTPTPPGYNLYCPVF